jgi:large subunit ribosomal protein L21
MFAIIESGSKQYQVAVGDILKVELLHKKEGSQVTFPVLFMWDGSKASIGKPHVTGKKVTAKVLSSAIKDKKIRIVKQKAKKRYRLTKGHRQRHTLIEITKI